MRPRFVVPFLAVTALAFTAHADEPSVERDSYAISMAATDLAILITAVPATYYSGAAAPIVLTAYVAAYWWTGSIFHLMHGNSRQTGRSLLRRLLLPLVGATGGALLGTTVDTNSCPDPPPDGGCRRYGPPAGPVYGAAIGAVVGVVGAAVFDWTRAHVDRPRPRSVTPAVTAQRDGVVVGLVGRF